MAYEVEQIELVEQDTAVVRGHVPESGVAGFLGSAFGDVLQVLAAQGLAPTGPPFGRYVPTSDGFDIEAGFPTSAPVRPTGRVEAGTLPGGTAVQVLHRGAYDMVVLAYQAAEAWLSEHGWSASSGPWESYLDGPEVAHPRTLVQVPCEEVTGPVAR